MGKKTKSTEKMSIYQASTPEFENRNSQYSSFQSKRYKLSVGDIGFDLQKFCYDNIAGH